MSLSWLNAATLLRITNKEKRDAGWPSSFTPDQLAILQYPPDGKNFETRARRQQGRMIATIREAAKNGSLRSASKIEQTPTIEHQTVSSPLSDVNIGSMQRIRTSSGMPARPIRPSGANIATITTYEINREDFSSWWLLQGEESSVHIRAWLGELSAAQTTTTKANKPYTPSNAKREARKLDTQAMYASWQKAYRDLKKIHRNKSDVWYSTHISRTPISKDRNASTIKKHMKS